MPKDGSFAFPGLGRVLHERARLGIMAALAASPGGVTFTGLKRQCALTDGNLSRHLDVLRESALIEVWKGLHNRRPQTLCRLTPLGRRQFTAYLTDLQRVVRDTLRKAGRPRRPAAVPPGFIQTP